MKDYSLYFHIPFCRKACPYCDFYFSTDGRYIDDFFSALLKEIELKKPRFQCKTIASIYFGGGTPSFVNPLYLEKVLNEVKKITSFATDLELTLELNTEDIKLENIQLLKKIGFNRLSLGAQSLRKKSLSYLGRYIGFEHLKERITTLKDCGFSDISLDFIYGFPTLLEKDWQEDLEKILQLSPTHLSFYSLTIEEKTRLKHLIEKKELEPIAEELARKHFLMARKMLRESGYDHYEVSNWALTPTLNQDSKEPNSSKASHRDNFYSKQNLRYWHRQPYLGFGPSAHSFSTTPQEVRSFNEPKLKSYIDKLKKNQLNEKKNILSLKDRVNEIIMLSLRTKWGLDLGELTKEFSAKAKTKFRQQIDALIQANPSKKLLNLENGTLENGTLKPTEEGLLYLDKITSEMFITEEDLMEKV